MKETPTLWGGVCREGLPLKFCINLVYFPPLGLGMKILDFHPGSLLLSGAIRKWTSFLLDLPVFKSELQIKQIWKN